MRFLLSGASGFVGSYLVAYLRREGHSVRRLVRHSPHSADESSWDPAAGVLDPPAFDGIDAVINLSGASIAGRRWTADYKRELVASRVLPTALLAGTLAALPMPAPLFISFSGAG